MLAAAAAAGGGTDSMSSSVICHSGFQEMVKDTNMDREVRTGS